MSEPSPAASPVIAPASDRLSVRPLQPMTLAGFPPGAQTVTVTDSAGYEYLRTAIGEKTTILCIAGGALGTHVARFLDAQGTELGHTEFTLAAETSIDDSAAGGQFARLLAACVKSMKGNGTGVGYRTWRGKKYAFYVHWILDHANTAKGMQFFAEATAGLVDLMAAVQREDGMVWSFIDDDPGPGFFDTRDHNRNEYTRRLPGELLLVRQPVENHCEYNFVNAMYLAWKSSGDDAWMASRLDAAIKALEYAPHDRARWSSKFELLQRGYTIDSWDFQVQDEYSVDLGIGSDMLIDPDRTKFGIFFGDNHGYATACDEMAEMLTAADRKGDADAFRRRASELRDRLSKLTWNGKFFTHRIETDPSVKRHLGVDESQQIAMSNGYATNRGITPEQTRAIVETYQALRKRAPAGAPAEWYAIYPPFERGFEKQGAKWQYMNGGVQPHAAGELARGALANGCEAYGVDVLQRIGQLADQSGGKVKFAYTGADSPDLLPQKFESVDLTKAANMPLTVDAKRSAAANWMRSSDAGNDLANLPTGQQTLGDVPYAIATGEKAAVSVSARSGFAAQVEIPLKSTTAGAVYLLHTVNQLGPSKNAAAVTFVYASGESQSVYLQGGKHVGSMWFPKLAAADAGIAWRGPNGKSSDVGVCWAAIENPQPKNPIVALRFDAALDGAIYACMGITLADRMPQHKPDPVSFGGPDQWSGGTVALALLEGLAGVSDAPGATAYRKVVLSPRWLAAGVAEVSAIVKRPNSSPAGEGYVAYRLRHNPTARTITVELTGSGEVQLRLLLPAVAQSVQQATLDRQAISSQIERVQDSLYAVVAVGDVRGPKQVSIRYV